MTTRNIDRDELSWRTARASGTSGCVEVAPAGDMVAVRHSKEPDAEMILYTEHEWRCFIQGAKDGEFDFFS